MAQADGFSVATDESFELAGTEGGDDEVVEVVPDVDDWELIKDGEVVNPHDEKVKEDVINEERAKEVEDLNKILEITSIEPKPSGTSAESSGKDADMTASQMSTGSVGSFALIPSDDKPEEKKDSDENKADIVDVDMEPKGVEVDKPAGKPAEQKMPRPEKQKAPESKAMPRQKAPRLNQETDKALRKLEEATEAKEQAVWLDPDDMSSRILKEYVGMGRPRFISTMLSYLLRGHAIERGRWSPEFDPLEMRVYVHDEDLGTIRPKPIDQRSALRGEEQ